MDGAERKQDIDQAEGNERNMPEAEHTPAKGCVPSEEILAMEPGAYAGSGEETEYDADPTERLINRHGFLS